MKNRWIWFFGAIVLACLVFVLVDSFTDTPTPGFVVPSEDIDTAMNSHADLFGSWVFGSVLILSILGAAAVFWAFYLQLFHIGLRRNAWAGRVFLCYALSILAGLWLVYRASNWALDQREDSILRRALDNQFSAEHVSFSGDFLPVGWEWGLRLDMLVLCLVGVVAGYLVYALIRKPMSL